MTLQQTQNTIAEDVRRLRLQHHLSKNALAEECNVCPNIIRRIEHGEANPRTDTLYRIAAYFGVEVYELQMPIPTVKTPENHRKAVLYLRKSSAYQQAANRYFAQMMDEIE